jgi:hypothetical protein
VSDRRYPDPAVPYVARPPAGASLGNAYDAGNPLNRWNPQSPYYWAFWDRDDCR